MRRAQSSTLSSTHGHTQGEMGSLQEMWGRVETVWGRVPCHISCPREYIEGGPLRLRPGPSAPRHPGAACGLGTRLGAASAFPMLGWWGVGAVVLRVDRPGTAQSRCKANWTPERAPKLRPPESRQDCVCQAFVWSQELAALDRATAVGVKDGPDCLHGAAHLGHLMREAIRVHQMQSEVI